MILKILSSFNKLLLKLRNGFKDEYSGLFTIVRIKKETENSILIKTNVTRKTFIKISGKGNSLISHAALIDGCDIVINGENNTIIIEENVKLRKSNIIVRGSNCSVTIGKGTTFGGVRIVNVGTGNKVEIGENCLFSDHIEIWASDTHSIFNKKNEQINKEKPIIIGNDVWIGSRVIILKGTEISNGAIVGMGAIVSKNVPEKSISVGVPNRVIKDNVHWTNEY